MKQLLRKAVALSRQHPRLWLPTIIAAALSLFWRQMGILVARQLIETATHGSSILESSSSDLSKLLWLAYLPTSLSYLIDASCFILAMLVTSAMVRRFLAPKSELPLFEEFSQYRLFSMVLLALQLWVLVIASAVLIMPALASLATSTNHISLLMNPFVVGLILLPLYFAFAYLLTPGALRFLSRNEFTKIEPETLAQARGVAILTGSTIAVLSCSLLFAARSFRATTSQATAFSIAVTIVAALPYTLLFIAFTLLVMDSNERAVVLRSEEAPSAAEAVTEGGGDWHG